MKICIVTHNVIQGDGQGRVNYEVVKEAIHRGYDITLLASKVAPELQQSSQINWITISVERWPTELLRNMVFSWQSAGWLRKHRPEFNLVVVNGAITSAAGDVNAVHFVHSSWLRSPVHTSRVRRDLYGAYHWLYTRLNASWEKKAFRQAKAVVAVSEKISQELVDIGIPRECIRVILNGVDLQEFSPGYADRRKWQLPEQVNLALFVGDIRTCRKNLDTVLHALVQVPELHLVVVGATEGSPYPQQAVKLELSARVHFLGQRHDVSEIMKAVDLFVFPSHYEPFGLVITEAMASGLPVITAATVGVADLVTTACGVVLPEPDDIPSLVKALRAIALDLKGRNQMGQVARSIAEQYSWASMVQSYVDLFEELSKQ